MTNAETKTFLNDVVDYLWERAQQARTRVEHEDAGVALRVIVELKKGTREPFLWACYMVIGLHPDKVFVKRQERQAQIEMELARCVPDYDPEEAARMKKVSPIPTARRAA
jgi:hypothetical protein